MNEQILLATAISCLPVLVRLIALVMTMPVIAGSVIPVRVRLAFVIAMAILIVPTLDPAAGSTVNPVTFAISLIHEALLGALMGMSLNIILAAVHLAGSLIEGLCGFSITSFGAAPDPESGNGVFARLFWWTAIAVFIASGGVGQMVAAMMGSFAALPAGSAVLDRTMLDFLVRAISQSFEFGLMTALPAVAALLVASVVLGMAQKNFPQLGGMQVGLGIKAICGMLAVSLVLISMPWMIRGGFDQTLSQLQELIQRVPTG